MPWCAHTHTFTLAQTTLMHTQKSEKPKTIQSIIDMRAANGRNSQGWFMSRKKKSAKRVKLSGLSHRRRPNISLWKQVKSLAGGTEEGKKKGAQIVFEKYWNLPVKVNEVLKKLCGADQPVTVRRAIANLLESAKIPPYLYSEILSILGKDPDGRVKKKIEQIKKKELETVLEATRLARESILRSALEPAKIWRESMLNIAKHLTQVQAYKTAFQTALPQKIIASIIIPTDYLKTINSIENMSSLVTRSLSNLVPSFYLPSTLEEHETVRTKEPVTHPLIERLDELPAGHANWSEYEDLCEEILNFCFVPPLLEGEKRLATLGGLHRRDLLYPIPHDVDGFWAYVKNAYSSLSLIVECKNYSDPISPNEVVITSKYFGAKKLGTFGIIVSRKGPDTNCLKQQIQYWQEEGKMIVCLSDVDLKDMIVLKLKEKDPQTVLDRQVRKLRESI